jgi:hypothetical protein
MDLLDLFEWFQSAAVGVGIRRSPWLFPVIEAVHLVAFALLAGALLILDLRLLGLGLTAQAPSAVERQTRPWFFAGFGMMVVTGTLLFLSEAIKLYGKDAFWVKLTALAAALVFTFALRNPAARRDIGGAGAKAVALVSMALWFTVAAAGRWIGFS